MMLNVTRSLAANECGVASGPNPTVICDGVNNGVPNEPGEINVAPGSETGDANTYPGGIFYSVPGLTLNLDGTASPLVISRPTSWGIITVSNGAAPHIVNTLGTVDVTAGRFLGIAAGNTVGSTTINYNGGTINTTGANTVSMYSYAQGAGDSLIVFSNGIINTTGLRAYGPTTWSEAGGNATTIFNAGSVTTAGDNAYGVYANPFGTSTGNGMVMVNSGTVTTAGREAIGAHVFVNGSGSLTIGVGAGTTINTTGQLANGILGTVASETNTAPLFIDNAGTINTTGSDAHGIWGWHGGSGSFNIVNTGDVTATGDWADGIRAEDGLINMADPASITYDVDVNAGTVTSGGLGGAGIHTMGAGGGTIDIAASVTIDGSASGVAIRDGDRWSDTNNDFVLDNDLNNDGLDDVTLLPVISRADGTDELYTAGDVVVTTAGALIGDSILGLGNDTFNLTSGSVTGAIYGDDAVASINDGDDSFNWTGGTLTTGFFGQNGSDTAVISAPGYDGSQILDGGDDASDADGWIDVLTVNGATATANAGNIVNWEVVNLVSSAIIVNDLVTPTLNICGGSTTLGGASMVGNVLGCVSDDTITVTDNTIVSNVIEGAGGSDTISILGNASVDGGVFGGSDGQDMSAAADAADLITVDTTGSVRWIFGDGGDDQIFLRNGTVTEFISGGDGDDYIEANGGSAQIIVGNDGDDTIIIDGAIIDASANAPDETSIDGNAGNDRIELRSGIVSGIDGDDG
ncbi:MAG: beta strand repeat-containing protein, partial [Hyphomicrobiales bacterium]